MRCFLLSCGKPRLSSDCRRWRNWSPGAARPSTTPLFWASTPFGNSPEERCGAVFTDGEDQGSRATLEDARRRVGETEALVYMVGAGRALDREAFRREMRNLSEPTGGWCVVY